MDKLSPKIWLLLTVVFAAVLTTYSLSHIVTHPWHEITELGADGGKNIFTYLYQVVYGKGLWFEGMNYPYGEHITYTDGQPLLSVPLSLLANRMSLEGALTVMWWFIAASYVLSIVYCFKILLQLGVKPLAAMCLAGLVTIFSPQMLRISGHYALSCACVLPMLFYWSLLYYNTGRWKYPVYIFILGLLSTFLHPYYAAVSLVWAGSYALGYLLINKQPLPHRVKHIAPLLTAVGTVFAIFGVFMRLTDTAQNRPATPFGILNNCTHIKDIITSIHSPVWAAIKGHGIAGKVSTGGEGYTYIGIAVALVTLLSFMKFIVLKWSKKPRNNKLGIQFPHLFLFMAFVALLFSMGAPFTWRLEWLLNYASLLKQFRTLGRFSWIFYYIITIYGSVTAYSWYGQLVAAHKKLWGNALLLTFIGLWGFEASGYIARTHKVVEIGYGAYDDFVSAKEQNCQQFLKEKGFKKENFQAVLVLPFFETGSEKLWVCSNENTSAWAVAIGIKAGMQLHLPLIDAMLSRTSWDIAFKQVKIAGGPYTYKPMLNDIKNDKPFLLLQADNEVLNPDQQYLLGCSDSIGHFPHCVVYACYPGRIRASDKQLQDFELPVKSTFGHVTPLYGITNDTCIKYTGPWYSKRFDENTDGPFMFFGYSYHCYKPGQEPVIAAIPIKPAGSQLYEFSCWFKVTGYDYRSPECSIEQYDSLGKCIKTDVAYTKESTDNIFRQGCLWLRCNHFFLLSENTRLVKCTIADIPGHTYEGFNELMLRPANSIIISRLIGTAYMINNHWVR